MSWRISGVERDPFRSQVSLLLHGNGANGSTTITDNSPTPKTVTPNGNAQISTAQSQFGGSSIAFDGTGDFLSIASDAAFAFPAEATIEFWLRLNAVSGTQGIYGQQTGSGGMFIYIPSTGRIGIQTGGAYIEASAGIAQNTWYYIAVTKSATNLYSVFLNGTRLSVVDQFGTMSSSIPQLAFNVGANSTGSGSYLNGFIDELRITKGVERQALVPTSPFPDI